MSTDQQDDLDARTLAEYRRLLAEAAAALGGQKAERAYGATAALFAALDRRDARERAMLEIVQAVANLPDTAYANLAGDQKACSFRVCWGIGEHTLDCPVTKARAVVAAWATR